MMKVKINEWYVGEPTNVDEYGKAISQGRKNLLSKYNERRIVISGKDLPDVLDELYNPGDYVKVIIEPNDSYYVTYELNEDGTFTHKVCGRCRFNDEILTYEQAKSIIKNSLRSNIVYTYTKK